jgi:F-type H+-transporting ATPase subunit epsilon
VKTFSLSLFDTAHTQTIADVVSFSGEDSSGSFGILAERERLITCLTFGMSKIHTLSGHVLFIAMPGGVLYFTKNNMTISTRHFVVSDDFEQIQKILQQEILNEEVQLQKLKQSFHSMETELMKRLLQTGQSL